MSTHQVIYTSCMRGIRGVNDGQQVFSHDALFEDADNDEIKRLYVYKPPELAAGVRMTEELALTMPKAFTFQRLDDGRYAISLSTYLGRDYMGSAGRFGNHLSHIVVADESDINAYPCEFFGSALLRDHMEFEEVNDPQPPAFLPEPVMEKGYKVDVDAVTEFLGIGERMRYYKDMLQAVLLFGKEHKRLLICDSPENIVLWIAALEYAFPLKTALNINFTTYEYDPLLSVSQICGVAPSGTRYNEESRRLSYVFDFAADEYEQFEKDSDFFDFVDAAFSLSFDSMQDFHEFLGAYSYSGADEEICSAYALYSLLFDGISNGEKLERGLAFADKYASETEKKRIAEILLSRREELLEADGELFVNILKYMLHMDKDIDGEKIKSLICARIKNDINTAENDGDFDVFYDELCRLCSCMGINITDDLISEESAEELFEAIKNDARPWKTEFAVRIICGAKKLALSDLAADGEFVKKCGELLNILPDAESTKTAVSALLDRAEADCACLTKTTLVLEKMLEEKGTDCADFLWGYYGEKMLSLHGDDLGKAYTMLLENERGERIFDLFSRALAAAEGAAQSRDIFREHGNFVIKKDRDYSARYGTVTFEMYYNKLSAFGEGNAAAEKRELFDLIMNTKAEVPFTERLTKELVAALTMKKPSVGDINLIKNAFSYVRHCKHELVCGKLRLLTMGILAEEAEDPKEAAERLEKLKNHVGDAKVDVSAISESEREDYFKWLSGNMPKICKSDGELEKFLGNFAMTEKDETLFADLLAENAAESMAENGCVTYLLGYISKKGSDRALEKLRTAAGGLGRSKMSELNDRIKMNYGLEKSVLAYWDSVKETQGKGGVFGGIAGLFRKKK